MTLWYSFNIQVYPCFFFQQVEPLKQEEPPSSSISDGLSSSSLDTDNLLVNSATLPDQILAQPPAPAPVTTLPTEPASTEPGSASIQPEDLMVPKEEPMDTGTSAMDMGTGTSAMDMGTSAVQSVAFPSSAPISSYSSESGEV